MDTYFAVTAPGLETFTTLELTRLGLLPAELHFQGGLAALYRANLHLRTASRILVRLGMPFLARSFPELVEKASRLPWERFLSPGQPVALRVTCHTSRLYHSEAVAERLLTAIEARLGRPSPRLKPSDDEESLHPPQLILARLVDDRCTVSIDSSGELLHRRGYRLATAKAPLRETLAAALLLASGWDIHSPLIDPFCGSGTIPIEAALMAANLPPGQNRRFACMDWPNFDASLWKEINAPVERSASDIPRILASDRDAGALKMAQENAARAGVLDLIQFSTRAVSAISAPASTGWVVTNPPYGVRVSEGKDLRNLYAQLGNVLRAKFPGWRAAILSSELLLLGHTGLKLDTSLAFTNGGLRVRLGCGTIP